MSLHKIVNNYIFKRRIVYFYALEYNKDISPNVLSFNLAELDNNSFDKINYSEKLLLLINKRKGDAGWQVFIYLENNVVKGYSFLHLPKNIEWHDSLPTRNDEARTVSSFVEPDFRGIGIRGELLKSQKNFCLENKKKLWCVIEGTNTSSIKATQKAGVEKVRMNYLVKIIGRNIFSILTNTLSFFFLWGEKRATR